MGEQCILGNLGNNGCHCCYFFSISKKGYFFMFYNIQTLCDTVLLYMYNKFIPLHYLSLLESSSISANTSTAKASTTSKNLNSLDVVVLNLCNT